MITNELYDVVHAGDLQGVSRWLDKTPEDLNNNISDGYAPLHVASMFGHERLVQHLVSRGALVNLNATNASLTTPLHLAVCYRDEEVAARIVRFLLESGAELNGKQAGGQTPLHHAVARGSELLVDTLIDGGADPFFKDDQDKSASDLARELSGNEPDVFEHIRASLKRCYSLPLET